MDLFKRRQSIEYEFHPDEVFLDARNLPAFDQSQLEGRFERPISKRTIFILGACFILLAVLFTWRIGNLQIARGETLREVADNNRLQQIPLFAERGVITDRTGQLLAWNEPLEEEPFSGRAYINAPGFAHVLGYVQYPARDSSGFYYRDQYDGKDGIEQAFNAALNGKSGLKLIETNVAGDVQSESTSRVPEDGVNLMLAIDRRVQQKMHEIIQSLAEEAGYNGGAGALMDIKTGELIALASAPEYDPTALTSGKDEQIDEFVSNENRPFLNRAVAGVYQPGSIVKPIVALGALEEDIITPEKEILSTGKISIPNPYYPDTFSIFRDWKAHGWVDMREAIAMSSNVYFYEVGGGYEDQPGLGIKDIEKYMRAFGFGESSGIGLGGEQAGLIPTPEWKQKTFGDAWRLGDTYHTAIGQYGFQITPLQAVRAAAALANDGYVLEPALVRAQYEDAPPRLATTTPAGSITGRVAKRVPASPEHFAVVREGMRRAVTDGTASGLSVPYVDIAAKTGTAEVGTKKKRVNSWAIGFFPYESPRYAFSVVMERGPSKNLIGGVYVMRTLFDWMVNNTPEYFPSRR